MTPAPISVERLPAQWLDAADRVEAGTRNLDSPPDRMFVISGESRAAAYRGCAKELSEALPALLHQLAELKRELHDAEHEVTIMERNLIAAERAREEATGLLREVLERDTLKQFNGECGCINHSRKAEREYESGTCPHQRGAAFLAASGGA